MHWVKAKAPVPKHGDTKTETVFAWLPTKMSRGPEEPEVWVWLETYRATSRFSDNAYTTAWRLITRTWIDPGPERG